MKDRLQSIALVVEIVSGIAIVVSLIAVAMQIRIASNQTALNTDAVQAATYQNLADDIMAINLAAASNLQLSELVLRIRNGGTFANSGEQEQYDHWINLFLEFSDMAYYQYQKGIISEERLNNVLGPLTYQFQSTYVQNRYREIYINRIDPEFAAHLEPLLRRIAESTGR